MNACGVAVAMPQGQSRVPNPLTGQQRTWELPVAVPSRAFLPGGPGRIGAMPAERAGGTEPP